MSNTSEINTIFQALADAKQAMEAVPQLQASLKDANDFIAALEDDIEVKDNKISTLDGNLASLEARLRQLEDERAAYFLRATEAEGKLDQMAGLLGLTPKAEPKTVEPQPPVTNEYVADGCEKFSEPEAPFGGLVSQHDTVDHRPSFLGYPIRPTEFVTYDFAPAMPSQLDLMNTAAMPVAPQPLEATRSIGSCDEDEDAYRIFGTAFYSN